jgi:hypothetical protein
MNTKLPVQCPPNKKKRLQPSAGISYKIESVNGQQGVYLKSFFYIFLYVLAIYKQKPEAEVLKKLSLALAKLSRLRYS